MTPVLPPYAVMLGLRVERDGGMLRFVLPYADGVVGRPGFLHGGAIGGLLEIAAIGTLFDRLGADRPTVKPITVTVDFMRGGRERETFASARIIRLGKRIANVEAHAWQDDRDRPIATARMTLAIGERAIAPVPDGDA